MNEDEETLTLHALEATSSARASPFPCSVGSDDPRAMEMAMREDVSGLMAALERWSAAKPAADGGFSTPSPVCEIVMLPGLTWESRNRTRGLHVLITKP
jgi:hypothetical protein